MTFWFGLINFLCIMVYQCPTVRLFHMSRSNLRTPWSIHFKFHRVIGIDGLTIYTLWRNFEFSFQSYGTLFIKLYVILRQFFVCHAVNWEPLCQFTSNFAWLLELIALWSVYFLAHVFILSCSGLWINLCLFPELANGFVHNNESILNLPTMINRDNYHLLWWVLDSSLVLLGLAINFFLAKNALMGLMTH
jgi:hypothetical protein